jgi:hypothetical protein
MAVADVLRSRLTSFAGLAALVSTRIQPGVASQNTARPYVTYQTISEVRDYGMGGGIGIVFARYQFDVFAESYDAARAIVDQLRLALDFWASPSSSPEIIVVTVENVIDGYEPDTGYFHPVVDFLVTHRE